MSDAKDAHSTLQGLGRGLPLLATARDACNCEGGLAQAAPQIAGALRAFGVVTHRVLRVVGDGAPRHGLF